MADHTLEYSTNRHTRKGRTYAIFQDTRSTRAAELAVQVREAVVADMLFRRAFRDPECVSGHLRRQAETRAEEFLRRRHKLGAGFRSGSTDLAARAVTYRCTCLFWGLQIYLIANLPTITTSRVLHTVAACVTRKTREC